MTWCVGHLVELSQPEAYNDAYAKWRLEDLPILPTAWKYQVSASTKKQFGILKDLMKREDVKSLVCATDAGREGELIFRLVYHQADCRKPFERLWISSMEDQAIRDGFAHLEPSTKYDALYEAALCRERADWIVGMNATRLFSCLYHQTLNVGRVMTPTLAMVVMRDAEIAAFDRIYNGVDWGFYPDPWAFNRMHYDAARRTLYIFGELTRHRTGNAETARLLRQYGVQDTDLITADSAEPKSVADYRSYGLFCRGAVKGPGSVDYSMKWLQALVRIVIDPVRCPDTAKEFTAYEYDRNKAGEVISGYPDRDNHHIDAVRYGTEPIWKRRGQ